MPDTQARNTTAMLALAIHAFDEGTLGHAAVEQFSRAVTDTLAVSMAGRNEPPALAARAYVRHRPPAAEACAWGDPAALSVEDACFVNAVSSHALDYDDVSSPLRGHPSAVLLPALLAVAQSRPHTKRELACAYAIGLETMVRMARALVSDHYARGWHATATLGTIGAAAAVSRLLRLPAAGIANAIGLAVAQASGTRANFGTDAKPFQAGAAALAGLRAALLASHGMSSGDCLEGSFGFSRLYANGEALAEACAGFGTPPLEIEASGLEIKKYPNCYATHRATDAALALRRAGLVDLPRIRAVHVTSNAGAHAPLVHHRPDTGTQARFSMEYAVAAALLDGGLGLASFEDDQVARAGIRALTAAVSMSKAEGPPFPRWTRVRITHEDGSAVERTVTALSGGADLPLSMAELRTKVQDCFSFASRPVDAATFVDLCTSDGATWLHDLLALLRAPSPA